VSLILDALRKADSERERETVPGLHTQPVPALSLETAAPARPMPWWWVGLGAGAVLLVALAWYVIGREAARPAERSPAAPDALATPAPAAAPPNALAAEPSREVAAPAPWPTQENRKAAVKGPGKAEPAVAPAPAGMPAVYAREQLPDNVRAALPPLAVGGSIYSSTPTSRSLILDGKLFRENDQVSTDLLLEEIRLKTAVLKFRGYRFEIRY